MSIDLMFSKHLTYTKHNTKEGGDSGYTYDEFIDFINEYPQFLNIENTYFKEYEYFKNVLKWDDKSINKYKNAVSEKTYAEFIIGYDDSVARKNPNLHYRSYTGISYCKWISASIYGKENYKELKLFYDMAQKLNLNLITYDRLIDEAYLEALRIKEENRGIKLNKEQGHVLSCVEGQCRWFYIPTGDTEVIIKQLGLLKEIQEADITTIIDEVQNENKIAMATFLEDTIIFGMNVPYIQYPNLNAYKLTKGSSTPVLQNTLNALSKTFGFAAYYEYNNDDELIASLAFSKKGKFTYGHFSSEGQGVDIFGTQKKPMEVNQKSILKSAKKQGITPEDMLVNLMKQKQKVKYFTQCNWMIEDMLSM
jgi:hypothetical protein